MSSLTGGTVNRGARETTEAAGHASGLCRTLVSRVIGDGEVFCMCPLNVGPDRIGASTLIEMSERNTAVITRRVEYRADGKMMIGHLALPAGDGARPGVLVGHEGTGLNDFQRQRPTDSPNMGMLRSRWTITAAAGSLIPRR